MVLSCHLSVGSEPGTKVSPLLSDKHFDQLSVSSLQSASNFILFYFFSASNFKGSISGRGNPVLARKVMLTVRDGLALPIVW